MSYRRAWRALAAGIPLLVPIELVAQTHTDVIRGHVSTDSGVAVSGATITITRAPDRATFHGASDSQGDYRVLISDGTGDYLVHIAALGRQAFRKRVTRVATDTVFVVDAKLGSAVQQLGPVTVQATTPKPVRGTGLGPFGTEAGAAEKVVDGVSSSIEPALAGDLTAAAATVPGISATSSGISAFGLGPGQTTTTLGGLWFAGSDVPREARTTTRVTTSTYDPSRGWFSGANVNVDLAGGNLLATRRSSTTVDAPAAQYTDAVSARLGQRYTNVRLNLGGDGPLTSNDRLFYSYGAQYAHRTAGIATLADAGADLLSHAGVARDSAQRLLQIANSAGIRTGAVSPVSSTTDDASFIARFDHAPFDWNKTPPAPSAQALALVTYAKWNRATALSLGPTAMPGHGGDDQRAIGMAEGLWSRYWGKDYLSDVRSAVTYNRSQATPSLRLPDGRVLVGSTFPDVVGGYSTLQFGGNGLMSSSTRQLTWETSASTQLYARQQPTHKLAVSADARFDDYALDFGANERGTFSYASLVDLAANRPSSFTRSLNTPTRAGGAWNAFLAAGDQWQPTKKLLVIYGARFEGNLFTNAPAYNAAVDRAFNARTDEAPSSVHVSPRLGFNWVRDAGRSGGGAILPTGSYAFPAASAWRGGIGEFRNMISPVLLNNALVSTGLPGGLARVTCIGGDVPTPDWNLYASNPSAIPSQCLNGANTAFNDAASSVQLFARDYQPPRSWRGNLGYVSQHAHFSYSIDGALSYGMNQPSAVDLNLRDTPAFTTSDEGRTVFVPTSAIVATTGVVSPVPGRVSDAFGRVSSNRSDMRTNGRQVTMTLSPNFSPAASWFTSVAYTLSSTRAELRGFDASTFGSPVATSWARSDLDARHQILLQASYRKNGFNVTAFGRATSGVPYTPMVGSDVNGDGLANDRAFIFDPSRVNDATFASSLRELHDAVASGARACLDAQRGMPAARNSCEGPWTASLNMQMSASGARLKLGQRLGLITLNLSNPLGGLDQVLHGSNNLRGWGTQVVPDPVLYNVRGFDAASSRYVYAVNPRFGATSPAATTLRAPFRVTLDVSLNVGRPASEQQLERWVDPGRSRPGTKLTVADLKKRYITAVPNPYPSIAQLTDSLLLSREQSEGLQRITADYNRKVDSAWTALATYLAALPDSYDRAEAVKHQEDAIGGVWEMTRLHVQANLRPLLSPVQLTMLPTFATLFNTTSTSMSKLRIFSGIRPT